MMLFTPQEKWQWEYWLHKEDLCQHTHCRYCNECPGHGRGGLRSPCCDRGGEYNGYP